MRNLLCLCAFVALATALVLINSWGRASLGSVQQGVVLAKPSAQAQEGTSVAIPQRDKGTSVAIPQRDGKDASDQVVVQSQADSSGKPAEDVNSRLQQSVRQSEDVNAQSRADILDAINDKPTDGFAVRIPFMPILPPSEGRAKVVAQKAGRLYCSPAGQALFSKVTDHFATHHILGELWKDFNRSGKRMDFVIGGINKAQGLRSVLNFPGYGQDIRYHRTFGFDIAPENINFAKKKFVHHLNLEFHLLGMSDMETTLRISKPGAGTGHLIAGSESYGGNRPMVNTTTLYKFLKARGVPRAAYCLIDVEGHETNVLFGMDLLKGHEKFPMFQYELGAFWPPCVSIGHRSGVHNWTQAHMSQFLRERGYQTFIMGGSKSRPFLMEVGPAFFQELPCGYKGCRVADGNQFNIKRSFLQENPGLAKKIESWTVIRWPDP